mmetsp:Transcript_23572/g.28310  ORF Transcript_23572/g.28310 Transcript_23572/m.28310 type:complete len:205 (+) Transcript_23572:92-706(+)|eukprot:CAMPEP_0195294778 /NCGR_PEP_ID=MMETSP0707-20130614/15854_1 /TAXON_ID=33640 /ORGANISM="Asterionellopsis glacialis, Strain CCMP134" /LENGTH=204 /DNA_ID=CAMNT_0040355835 /DNA_START=98 /DNA_END=712 /DNA_ORIENTATION=+
MVKQSSSSSSSLKDYTSKHKHHIPHKKQKRSRPPVQVVSCPTDFPKLFNHASTSSSSSSSSGNRNSQRPPYQQPQYQQSNQKDLLDWHDTSKEIRALGATAFEKKQKRQYDNEMYQHLTGRTKKHHSVPLPIVRGIKKKALQRQQQMEQEAKQAGIVLPSSSSTKNKNNKNDRNTKDRNSRIHGPAPSVGFMKKGVLNVPRKRS